METLFYYSLWALTVVFVRRWLKRDLVERNQERTDKIWRLILNTNPEKKDW